MATGGPKQRDISSFFGKAAKPATPGDTAAGHKDVSKENKRGSQPADPKKVASEAGDGRRLKRLKRSSEAEAAGGGDPQVEDVEDAMEEDIPGQQAADGEAKAADGQQQQQQQQQQQEEEEEAKGQEEPSKQGAPQEKPAEEAKPPAPSPAKVSRQEASQAFSKLFAGGKAAAAGGAPSGGAKGSKGTAAKSPAAKGDKGAAKGAAAGAATPKKQQQKEKGEQVKKEESKKDEEEEEGEGKKGKSEATPAAGDSGAGPSGCSGGGAAAAAAAKGDEPSAAAKPRRRAASPGAADGSDYEGSSDGEEEEEEEVEEEEEGAGAKSGASGKSGSAPRRGAVTKAKKSKVASMVEGVGTGALEAAARHAAVDVPSLITWKPGSPVPYAFLTSTFEAIAETTKRLEIVAALTGCFRAVLASSPGDLLPAVYLCSNRVGPPHEGLELGVGEAILIKALAETTGKKEATVKKDYEAAGDLGAVAAAARTAQKTLFKPPPLTVAGVFKAFRDIALASGPGCQDRKRKVIGRLLVASTAEEPGYIMRSLQGRLRIGLAEQSLLAALAHAVELHRGGAGGDRLVVAERLAEAEAVVKQVYSECPSFDRLVPALLDHPLAELPQHVTFTPGVPVRPMLAKATNGVAEVLEKFSDCEFTCEYKYDGERCQVHVQNGGRTVSLYSRNAEDQTPKFPDVVARLPGWLAEGVESIVVDAEAVAWDPVAKKIQPFQVLSTRARKDVGIADIKVQVMVFAFDCLYLNGRSLLHRPLSERREALYASLKPVPGELDFAIAKTSRDVEELAAFLNEAVAASTEGLIVKTMGDEYQPARRSTHWLKLKKDYLDGCGDTFDVVPIGAYYGKGKRSGVYGAYLLAVYDADGECYQTISKLGTGFSEEQLVALSEALKPHVLEGPRPYYQYGEGQAPDVWFDPVAVWEVKAADLSVSPVHQAARGLVEPGKGISIRFPRLLRVREDKAPEDATTAEQVADMYRAQAVVAANRGNGGGGDDE